MVSPRNTGEPAKGGEEHDAFSRWRKLLCSFQRPGVAKAAKRSYNRRVRRSPIADDCPDDPLSEA